MISRLRWTVLTLLCLSTVINYIDRQALSVVLPTLRKELGLSSVDYGAMTTAFLVSYTVAQIFAGVMVDRIGTRIGLAISVCVWSIAAVAHAFAQGAASLIALRVALGIGEAGNWPAGTKAISEWLPRSRRAFSMGLFDGGSAVGAIIAPPMVAWLTLSYGWRTAFVATGLIGFAWLGAWLRYFHHPAKHPALSEGEREAVLAEVGEHVAIPSGGRTSPGLLAGFLRVLRLRKLWGLMTTRMIATPVWWFYVFWLPDYLSKDRGFSLKEIGMFGWLPFLTVDLGKIAGGALSDRFLRSGMSATMARKSVMIAAALAMTGGLPVVNAPTAAAAIAWVCLATFGFGMWSANILALHADMFPQQSIATATGLTGTAASLGGAVFTYATGWLVDSQGYAPVFAAVGTLSLFALVSLVFFVGKVERLELKTVEVES